jgi:hypothetical protein
MSQEKIYLELSEGSSHKFYEGHLDQVLPSARGGFYRALGNIRKLVS